MKQWLILLWAVLTVICGILNPTPARAESHHPCLRYLNRGDCIIVADPTGRILVEKNASRTFVPASILKIVTAMTALHYLGPAYRFETAFYVDSEGNLKVKGYGDPLFISEVILDISDALSKKLAGFGDLIIDDTYFALGITIPGQGTSTNPYDAPVGAFCANFNTIRFHRDGNGKVVSSEKQTPITPFARKKIDALKLKKGRQVVSHSGRDGAWYAGELLLHFLNAEGVKNNGRMRFGKVNRQDVLIYRYHSRFTLETVIRKMLEFSNNFMANQLFIAAGARVYGPPGTLEKGIHATQHYLKQNLSLKHIDITEGSGLSRKNRLTGLDMLTLLKGFKPCRHLMKSKNGLRFKTGTLRGVHTRAGYLEASKKDPFYFVISVRGDGKKIAAVMECIQAFYCP